MSDVDPVDFAREANTSNTLRMSPLEQAKVDATNVNNRMMSKLVVDEGKDIDKALKSPENREFVNDFLSTVPDNERATLLTRDGSLNQMGLYRAKAAVYTRTFQGESGERMAESLLENLDPDLKNVQNGLTGALPGISRAEALIASGERAADLSISNDVAVAVDTMARVRNNDTFTRNVPADQVVSNYLNNYVDNQMFGGSDYSVDLTPDQRAIMLHLDGIRNSPKRVREFFHDYSRMVEQSANPNQGSLMDVSLSRQEMLDRLLRGDQVEAAQPAMMF
jgi:hypothetical protein